jgi:hypothetical protein
MSASEPAQARTRTFARVLGPFFFIVPATIAVRASHMRTLFAEFETSPLWAWVLGAGLLMFGLVIIGLHQYWRSVAAVIVSLLGWFLAVRGLLLLIVPQVYNAAGDSLAGPVANVAVRVGFAGLSLVGLYLTYVGWSRTEKGP